MAQWLRENLWRQGHLLTADSAKSLGLSHSESPGKTAVVVISHDCDLAQGVESEPDCEVVIGRTVSDLNGNFANAKSARRLHLRFLEGASQGPIIELDAIGKSKIQKEQLSSHQPEQNIRLGNSERTVLQAWLAGRYRRSAFPDEFDRRLTKEGRAAYEKIVRTLKRTSDDIMAIFFDVDGGEDLEKKGPDDTYALSIFLLYSVEHDPEKGKVTAMRVAEEIKKIFRDHFFVQERWLNIELLTCEAWSEDDVTVRVSRLMRRWNLDYVSLREDQATLNN